MASTVRAYALPIILFAGAMFYQLFIIPNAFPPSHYDGNSFFIYLFIYWEVDFFTFLLLVIAVLQIESYSSIDKVQEAYEKLESKL